MSATVTLPLLAAKETHRDARVSPSAVLSPGANRMGVAEHGLPHSLPRLANLFDRKNRLEKSGR